MFVITIHYKSSIEEIDKYLKAHRDFLDIYYKKGFFLASGPQNPRVGGIIVATGPSREELQEILKLDPFHQAGIAEYEITEFHAIKYRDEIKDLL